MMDATDRAILRTVAELDAGASLDRIAKRHGTNVQPALDSMVERGLMRSYVLVVTTYYALTMAGAEALDVATTELRQA